MIGIIANLQKFFKILKKMSPPLKEKLPPSARSPIIKDGETGFRKIESIYKERDLSLVMKTF